MIAKKYRTEEKYLYVAACMKLAYDFTIKASVEASQLLYAADGDNGSFKALCSEVADVLVMAQQMRLLMGAKVIDEIIDKKLNRQLGRIAHES